MIWKTFQKSDDAATAVGEEKASAAIPAEAPPAAAGTEEQLRAEIEALKRENAQLQDRFLRKAAELENHRKRTERERLDASQLARSSVLTELLPIADSCDRAVESVEGASGSESFEQFREGVRLLHRQLQDTLVRVGVQRIESTGKPFDPHLHEAVARQESDAHPEGTVLQELRCGYILKDRLLRAAQVMVSTRPQTPEQQTGS